jgi:hypothetical protein
MSGRMAFLFPYYITPVPELFAADRSFSFLTRASVDRSVYSANCEATIMRFLRLTQPRRAHKFALASDPQAQ